MNVSWSIYIHLKLAILGNVQTICYSHIVRVYFENISYFYQIHLCRCSYRNSYQRRVLEILENYNVVQFDEPCMNFSKYK